METKKTKKKRKIKNKKIEYYCECCDYTTSRKSQYDRHLNTRKHIMSTNVNKFGSESSNGYNGYDWYYELKNIILIYNFN